MKILCISLLISIGSLFAQDSLTIVAVGEAEKDKDHIFFQAPKNFGVNKKLNKESLEIIKKDFMFYRHMFELDAVSSKQTRYKIETDFSGNSIKVKLLDLKEKKELSNFSERMNYRKLRHFSHSVANKIYKTITGNDSIFTSKILFASNKNMRNRFARDLYIMDFDGHRKQRITYENTMLISPSISKNNSEVLYTAIESRWRKSSRGKVHKVKNPNLYKFNLKTRKRELVSDVKGINSGAIFAEDGKHIYLTLSFAKNSDIYRMNLKTKEKKKITSHFSDDVDPHINADGSLITFLSGRSGRAMIYTANPRDTERNVKRISYVGKFNSAPRFSPDGKQIVFSSWVDNRFDIYKINSNGRNLLRLTKNFGSNEEAWFSPDGQFIVFTSQRVISRRKATQDVYIMNIDGEIISKITDNFGHCFTPRWFN